MMLFADLVEITLVEYFLHFGQALVLFHIKQNQNLPMKLKFGAIRGFGEHSLMHSIIKVKRHPWSNYLFVSLFILLK